MERLVQGQPSIILRLAAGHSHGEDDRRDRDGKQEIDRLARKAPILRHSPVSETAIVS